MLKTDDAKLPFNTRLFFYALNYAIHGAYIKWSSGLDLKKKLRLYVELKFMIKIDEKLPVRNVLREKNRDYAASLKYSVQICVE
jgi:hypothetical protein